MSEQPTDPRTAAKGRKPVAKKRSRSRVEPAAAENTFSPANEAAAESPSGWERAQKALTGGQEPTGRSSTGGAGHAGEGSYREITDAGQRPAEREHLHHVVRWPSADHVPTPVELSQMIAEAAYFRAERRGFHAGYDIEDWLGAEAEIMARLRELEKASHSNITGG